MISALSVLDNFPEFDLDVVPLVYYSVLQEHQHQQTTKKLLIEVKQLSIIGPKCPIPRILSSKCCPNFKFKFPSQFLRHFDEEKSKMLKKN